MKLYRVLYSRSYSKDYRWIFKPSFFQRNDNDLLKKLSEQAIANQGNRLSNGDQKPLSAILLLPLSNNYALVKIGVSSKEDYVARPIRYLAGIAFELGKNNVTASFIAKLLRACLIIRFRAHSGSTRRRTHDCLALQEKKLGKSLFNNCRL